MRIAFIDPTGINKGLNLGLGILASCLSRCGYEVKVVDLNNNMQNAKRRIGSILKYDIIGVSIKSFTLRSALGLARQLQRKDLICGGPHVTLDGVNLLQENPCFEVGAVCEAEETLPKIFESRQKHLSLDEVSGIIYRQAGQIKQTLARPLVADLDALPFADYSVFDSVGLEVFDYPIMTSRGCPYSCIYCCVGKVSGKKMRFRSIEKVAAEIEEAKAKYKAKNFHILDDNFTFDVGRAKEFCRLLINNKINMPWSCPNGIRADCIDEELVSLMKHSGCRQVSIGIESLDEEVFAGIKKGERQEEIRQAIARFNKYRIKVGGFFLIGLPRDNLRKSLDSIKKCQEIGLDTAHWNIFVPYPGTEAWDWVNNDAKVIRDWKEGFHFGPRPRSIFETREFGENEMIYIYKLTNIKFKNYSAFFDKDAFVLINLVRIIAMVIRYDLGNLFSHLRYICKNMKSALRYIRA